MSALLNKRLGIGFRLNTVNQVFILPNLKRDQPISSMAAEEIKPVVVGQ